MSNQPNPAQAKRTIKEKDTLHHFVATGGKPKNFKGSQGATAATIPGYKK